MLAKTVTFQEVKGAGKENCLRITSDKGSFYMATVVQDPKKWKDGLKSFDAKEIDPSLYTLVQLNFFVDF